MMMGLLEVGGMTPSATSICSRPSVNETKGSFRIDSWGLEEGFQARSVG
jgi:hypothetical protein